jgi:Zn finger protein HypA/HybF involved in hydrogenase expression
MSYDDYDDDYTEWEDQCSSCGSKFLNEGMHGGVDCPHCIEADEKIDAQDDDY